MPQTIAQLAFADPFPFRAPCPGGCGSHLLRDQVNAGMVRLYCMDCSWSRFARRTASGAVQISKSPLFDDCPTDAGVEQLTPPTNKEIPMAVSDRLTRSEYQRWVRQGRPDLDKWIADGKPFLKGGPRGRRASTPAVPTDSKPAAPAGSVIGVTVDPTPVKSGPLPLPPGTTEIAVYLVGKYVTVCAADGLVLHQIRI
jgi:hypothetical protein